MMKPGEQQSDDDGVAHASNGFAHDVGLIVENAQFDAGGKFGPDRFDFLVGQVGDFHRVAVRLAADAQKHRGLSIRRDDGIVRRGGGRHDPNVPDTNRSVIHILDDHVADIFRVVDLRIDQAEKQLVIAAERPGESTILVLLAASRMSWIVTCARSILDGSGVI